MNTSQAIFEALLLNTLKRLIRPPRRTFVFTYIHGITWPMVARQPGFGEVWPELEPLLEGAAFFVAQKGLP